MSQIKVTELHIRGFDCDFIVKLEKDYFVSLEQAIVWAKKEMIDTAMVRKVVQKWSEGDFELINEDLPNIVLNKKTDESAVLMEYSGKLEILNVPKEFADAQMEKLTKKK